jgi:two-component system sensor histidine kinase YesM
MKKLVTVRSPFKSLSVNVFLLIMVFLLIPIYISLIIFRKSYENYIQQELSNQIIANIKKGEDEFYQTFQRMANISNVFTSDRELINRLNDNNISYYNKTKRFDEVVNTLLTNNLFDLKDIKITMFDTQKRGYANWSLNFYDYSFILDEDWVRDSLVYKGHITWSLFAPSFVQMENERYISLARSILYPAYTGERLATLIISINQREISARLTRNGMDADFIRVCTEDSAEDVFGMDNVNILQPEDIRRLLRETAGTENGGMLCDLGGNRYLLSYYTLPSPWVFNGQRLVARYFTDYQRITDNLTLLSQSISYGMLFLLITLIVIMAVIAYTIAKPIRILDKKVNQYTRTRKISIFNTRRQDEIGDLNRSFLDMEIRINDLFDKLRQESELREQYHFQALRTQINPHFLFNTLNTIRWMAVIRKADNIEDTINALSRILEYSMGRMGEIAVLGEELEMIRSYIHIQNYRYGEDLEVRIDIEKELEEYHIVKFILQPVVENSFIHAFKKIRRKKMITITGRREESCLKLYVQDNGAGMSRERLAELRTRLAQGDGRNKAGIGIVNVHQRIRAGYGDDEAGTVFGLSLDSTPEEGTVVEYTLPLFKEDKVEENHGGG